MSGFDVEGEAGDWCNAHGLLVPSTDEERKSRWMYDDIKDLLTRCRDETELKCAKDACGWCELGDMAARHADDSGDWVHCDQDDEQQLMVCDASSIHERRRRREEG